MGVGAEQNMRRPESWMESERADRRKGFFAEYPIEVAADYSGEFYDSCRNHERETNYVKCETCEFRFICWTKRGEYKKPYRIIKRYK